MLDLSRGAEHREREVAHDVGISSGHALCPSASVAWTAVFGFAVLLGPLGGETSRAQSAGPADASSTFAAQLAAGEFSSALADAAQIPPGPQRDQALRQVALAQNDAGARQASLITIGNMEDDRAGRRAKAVRHGAGRRQGISRRPRS